MRMDNIRYRFKSNSKIPRSTWEITHFVDRIASFNYKAAIHKEIAKILATSPDISMENIVVFQNNFPLYSLNKNFIQPLNIPDDIEKLLTLGIPISFSKNKKMQQITSTLIAYHKFNSFLKENGYDKIQQRYLRTIYDYINQMQIKKLFIFIAEQIKTNIKYNSKHSKNHINKHNDQILMIEKFIEYIDSFRERIYDKQYRANEIELIFEEVFLLLQENTTKKYHENFEDTMMSLERPVVAIFITEKNSFKFICTDFIVKSEENENNFKILSITQNSPIEIILLSILGFLTVVTSLVKLEAAKTDVEIKNNNLVSSKNNVKHSELNNTQKKMTVLREALRLQKDFENTIYKIKDPIAKKYLETAKKKINDEFEKSLELNNMELEI